MTNTNLKRPFAPRTEQPEPTIPKPSAYKDAVVLDKATCERWLNTNPAKTISKLVVEYVPPKPGNLMARINMAMLNHSIVLVSPNVDFAIAPFMTMYGFRQTDIENEEGFVGYKR
jgi:hypothetical protein